MLLCLNLHEDHTVQLVSYLIGAGPIMYCVSFHFEIN